MDELAIPSVNDRVIVQGMTGTQGMLHTVEMLSSGTEIVGGVNPGHGGSTRAFHLPGARDVELEVYDTVREAVSATGAVGSVVFVPARHARQALEEAVDGGLGWTVAITEHIPVHDALQVFARARERGVRIIGPNCPGLVRYEQDPATGGMKGIKLGIIPASVTRPGNVCVISRSGTLTYEVVGSLSRNGIGQSLVIGIGGDMVVGTDMDDMLVWAASDLVTDAVVLVGEIGSDAEERAAGAIRKLGKPVVAYIAGRYAPVGKRMGHAGAMVSGSAQSASAKLEMLREAGARTVDHPWEVPVALKEYL